jgi:hypothetical protein
MKENKIVNFKQYHKDYYQNNKEAMLAYGKNKVQCEKCNRSVTRNQLLRHQRTKICEKNALLQTVPV